MPYNQILVEGIRIILEDYTGIIENKMFGGIGFILNGNMACGVLGADLIVRVGADQYSAALSRAYVKPFLTPTGKPMSGWVLVAMQGLETDQELRQWVEQGYQFAQSLPEKK